MHLYSIDQYPILDSYFRFLLMSINIVKFEMWLTDVKVYTFLVQHRALVGSTMLSCLYLSSVDTGDGDNHVNYVWGTQFHSMHFHQHSFTLETLFIYCQEVQATDSRVCQKSTFFEIKNEYPWKLFLLGHWYRKYKFFHSNPLFSSSPGFLTVLHLPSGDEKIFVDNPPLSYIKSCVLTCRLQIWTSFLVLPRQNIE